MSNHIGYPFQQPAGHLCIDMLWQTRLWPECGCVLLVCRHSPHHDNIIFEDLRAQATKVGFSLNFFVIGFFRLAIERTIEITLVTCIYL